MSTRYPIVPQSHIPYEPAPPPMHPPPAHPEPYRRSAYNNTAEGNPRGPDYNYTSQNPSRPADARPMPSNIAAATQPNQAWYTSQSTSSYSNAPPPVSTYNPSSAHYNAPPGQPQYSNTAQDTRYQYGANPQPALSQNFQPAPSNYQPQPPSSVPYVPQNPYVPSSTSYSAHNTQYTSSQSQQHYPVVESPHTSNMAPLVTGGAIPGEVYPVEHTTNRHPVHQSAQSMHPHPDGNRVGGRGGQPPYPYQHPQQHGQHR
jgi:hypothetical protein